MRNPFVEAAAAAKIPNRRPSALVPEAPYRYWIDWRALERNKYAPWGRGRASGLPITPPKK